MIRQRSNRVRNQQHEYGPAVIVMSDSEAEDLKRESGAELIVTPLVKYSIARVPTFPTHARRNNNIRVTDITIGSQSRTVNLGVRDSDDAAIPGRE